MAYAEVDLLEVSAWTYAHRSPYHYQTFSCQSYNIKHTSTCPYHVATMDSDHSSTVSRYGSAPLQRWLDEDVEDGGAMALQLGHQSHADCTCISMKDSVRMDVVSGTKHRATLEN